MLANGLSGQTRAARGRASPDNALPPAEGHPRRPSSGRRGFVPGRPERSGARLGRSVGESESAPVTSHSVPRAEKCSWTRSKGVSRGPGGCVAQGAWRRFEGAGWIVGGASEEEGLSSFSESEFTSPGHRFELADFVASHNHGVRLLATHPSKLGELDRAATVVATRKNREPLLGGLLRLKPSWRAAGIPADELASLRPLDCPPCNELAPDRLLATLVKAMHAGRDTPEVGSSSAQRTLLRQLRAEEVLGLPGIVGRTECGPFVVFDGLTRLCVLLHRSTSGESFPQAIRVFSAQSTRCSEWRWAGL